MKYLYLLLFCLLSGVPGPCPDELEHHLLPVKALTADHFHFLDDYAAAATVVGYGEATHGSAEFTELAGELFRYLVEGHGYTVLAIETMVGEGIYLDQYVQGQRDDLPQLLEEINSSWRYRTDEFADLLRWIRAYNQTATTRIHLRGCEMQYVRSDAEIVQNYLRKKGSSFVLADYRKHLWQNWPAEEVATAEANFQELQTVMNRIRGQLATAGDRAEHDDVMRHVTIIGQFIDTTGQDSEAKKHQLRDRYMADNLLGWLAEADTKMMYWAHNGHVGNGTVNGSVKAAGHYLRQRLGDAYYAIATDFGSGDYLAFPPNAAEVGWIMGTYSRDAVFPNTLTYCLQRAAAPHAFADLRTAQLADTVRTMAGAGVHAPPQPTVLATPGHDFDGLLFLDRVQPLNFFTSEIGDSAAAYLDEFFAVVSGNVLDKADFDWPALRATADSLAGGAQVPSHTYPAVGAILGRLNKHSRFFDPATVKKWNLRSSGVAVSEQILDVPLAEGRKLNQWVAYLSVPPTGTGHQPTLQYYADSLHTLIRRLDGPRVTSWVIDLRENTGGNCWPMLAGIGTILGEGVCGYFMDRDGGNPQSWSYRDGEAYLSDYFQISLSNPAYSLHHPSPSVAVLTGSRTMSSGEVVATAFRGRPATRSFGRPTGGYSTTNNFFPLSDGAIVNLTISIYADRNKRGYGSGIPVDVETDTPLKTALEWLSRGN